MTWKILALLAIGPALARGAAPALDPPADLTTERRELVDSSLKALEEHPGLPYLYAGSCPEDGGMDCSGTVSYLLGLQGLDPPRSAAEQYAWIKNSGKLTVVPVTITNADDPVFAGMLPGDLLFWANIDPDGTQHVSHVEMYLGKEAKDGRRIMIGASDGRSYRGVRKNGFDIVDFQIPKTETKKLVGYGPPVWEDRKKAPALARQSPKKDPVKKTPANKGGPTKETPGKDTAGKDTAGKDTAGKDTAGKDTASKDTAGKDTPTSASSDKEPAKKDPPKKETVKKKPVKKETPKKSSRKRDVPDNQ